MNKEGEKFFESKEIKESKSKVILHVLRHGEKAEKLPGQSDYEVLLSEVGRTQARKKGEEINLQPEVGLVVGSPRKRTLQTGLEALFYKYFTPEASFEEIQEKIQEELDKEYKLGPGRVKKFIEEKGLDFVPYEELTNAVKRKEVVKFLVEESDKLILEKKDKNSTCWTRAATNVAKIIKKYLTVGTVFENIVEKNPEKYAPYGNQLERYLVTHQSIGESFLAKVIEKVKGKESLEKWVEKYKGGFKETEGFSLEILGGKEILIHYSSEEGKEETIKITPELIDELIKEGEEFEKKIAE